MKSANKLFAHVLTIVLAVTCVHVPVGFAWADVPVAMDKGMSVVASDVSNASSASTVAANVSSASTVAASTGVSSSSTTVAKSTKTTADLDWYPKDPSSFQDFHNTTASRVIDNADLLTDAEEAELAAHIADMTARTGLDFILLTDTSSYGLTRDLYAADFYQFNGYGLGDNYSGVIYFVCMERDNRGFYTAARGDARTLLTENNVNAMDDKTYDLFVDGDYAKAIRTQFDSLDSLYTNGSLPIDRTPFLIAGVIAIVIGLIGGFVNLSKKRRQMKTVETATNASIYSNRGLTLTNNLDVKFNTVVTRTKRESDDNHGGGGSSYSGGFSSSGGGSFSGGGRSF